MVLSRRSANLCRSISNRWLASIGSRAGGQRIEPRESPRIKLVALDLDGTIVRLDGSVSGRVIKALEYCVASGASIVFVTGRAPDMLRDLPLHVLSDPIIICSGGATLFNAQSGQVEHTELVGSEAVARVLELGRSAYPVGRFCLETVTGSIWEPGFRSGATTVRKGTETADVRKLGPMFSSVIKVLFRNDGDSPQDMMTTLSPQLSHLVAITYGSTRYSILEFAPHGVNKGSALEKYALKRQIDQGGVIAFGDQPNDLEMLTWVGRGFAMANGHPNLLQTIGEVAPSIDSDGVAVVLERLMSGSTEADCTVASSR